VLAHLGFVEKEHACDLPGTEGRLPRDLERHDAERYDAERLDGMQRSRGASRAGEAPGRESSRHHRAVQ
jgi:hypothetical protein